MRLIRSLSFSGLDKSLEYILNLTFQFYLARLIAPDDYGLISSTLAVIGILMIFKDVGLSSSLIYKMDITDRDVSTIMSSTLILASIISVVIQCFDSLIIDIVGDDRAGIVLDISCVMLFLSGLSNIYDALIRKNGWFRLIFIRNLVSVVCSGVLAIYLAQNIDGYMALLIMTAMKTILDIFISLIILRKRYRLILDINLIIEHFSYGIPIMLNNMTSFLYRNVDNYILGKYVSFTALGHYTKAYGLMLVPVRQFGSIISNVCFPYLRSNNNREEAAKLWFLLVFLTMAIVWPALCLVDIYRLDIINFLLGSNWIDAADYFHVLLWASLFQSLDIHSGIFYNACNKNMLFLRVGLWVKTIAIIIMTVGFFVNGVVGLMYGLIGTSLLGCCINIYYTSRLLAISISAIVKLALLVFGVLFGIYLISQVGQTYFFLIFTIPVMWSIKLLYELK